MKTLRPAVVLLLIQMLLVLSVAGKYLYERRTRPRVWTRVTQYDPNEPLRGRYLALQLLIDACTLPRDKTHYTEGFDTFTPDGKSTNRRGPGTWAWDVSLGAVNGQVVPQLQDRHSTSRSDAERVSFMENKPCDRAWVSPNEEFFIPDTAKGPFPLKPGQELWVEVTLTPAGPPRPIQLALSNAAGFYPIKF